MELDGCFRTKLTVRRSPERRKARGAHRAAAAATKPLLRTVQGARTTCCGPGRDAATTTRPSLGHAGGGDSVRPGTASAPPTGTRVLCRAEVGPAGRWPRPRRTLPSRDGAPIPRETVQRSADVFGVPAEPLTPLDASAVLLDAFPALAGTRSFSSMSRSLVHFLFAMVLSLVCWGRTQSTA